MEGVDNLNLNEDETLAEFIGIILGDGHVHKRTERSYLDSAVLISLNRVDEPQYVDYVKHLMFKIFNKQARAFA